MRLYNEDQYIKQHRYEGMTGLELESHRITGDGQLAHTDHPFPDHPYIVRDFSEDQIEINTVPAKDPEEALRYLRDQLVLVNRELANRRELLWPFSNPPILKGEEDIVIARYSGDELPFYEYRVHLAQRYGKNKMTYSGIHFNYSFSDDLLRHNYSIDQRIGKYGGNFREYKDRFYLDLAEKALVYSWAVVALLSASPVVDNSFYESGKSGESLFTGFSSLRCSELGYWNLFLPILSYQSVDAYTDTIQDYIDRGLLLQARELYYPIRIKPTGAYTLEALKKTGINRLELRQIDLNPFVQESVDLRDMEFLRLLLVWLASQEMESLSQKDQMQALQNHKAAAAYDPDLARITLKGQETKTLRQELEELLRAMEIFYQSDPYARPILLYQREKTENEKSRYACRVRTVYGKDFINEGMRRAREIQEKFLCANYSGCAQPKA